MLIMNRLVQQRATWWVLASWLVVLSVTADSINLDDLVPGVYVAHDEVEATSLAPGLSITHPGVLPAQRGASKVSHTRSSSRDRSGVATRIVFDEDSPSEAARPVEITLSPVTLSVDEQSATFQGSGSESPLHLLYCSLLI